MDNTIKYISISELIPGEFHPHLEYKNDNIDNLTNSIKNYGILEPLIVRPKNNKYEIILGNRRYKAAISLGLEKIPVIILELSDEKSLELIISDNIQRKELTGKEEAYLYDKALSYPNTNTEKLSNNLGIPLDRITSKLNLLKPSKKENIKLTAPENQILDNNIIQDNSINKDVINLSELNKKEEREDYNMNNNQFLNNNNTPNNLNLQGQSQNQSPVEPTFGGRFFPSLEDEPTNMNVNNNINIPSPQPQPQSDITANSPLIDLTDLSINETPTPQMVSNIPEPQEINLVTNNQVAPVPTGIDPSFTQSTIPTPSLEQPIPTPQINITPPTTEIQPQPIIEQPTIPNFNQPQPSIENSIPTPINIESSPKETKDILPATNLIKNIAISLESFGYKLEVTETDLGSKYSITIEIEK